MFLIKKVSKFQIVITHLCLLNLLEITNGQPPQGLTPPKVLRITKDVDAGRTELFCLASGQNLHFVWEKVGLNAPNWKEQLGVSVDEMTGILTIPRTDSAHFGMYRCRATNIIGSDAMTYDLKPTVSTDPENTGGIIGGIAATIAVVVLLLVWICMEFTRKARNGLTKEEIQIFRYGNPEFARGSNTYAHENVDAMPFNHDKFEIKRENLHVDKMQILGEGQFGRVLLGHFKGEKVAIKTVKPGVDKAYLKALLGEVKVMGHIGEHTNVIKFVGVCSQYLRNGELFLVLEICDMGSLESILRKCTSFLNEFDSAGNLLEGTGTYENKAVATTSFTTTEQYSNSETIKNETDTSLSTRLILNWAIQVARAMDFLASKKVIHGDLAARNVLITSSRTAKITDFGLSRKLYDYSNYVKKNQEPLPWRWMAIESLRELSFSPLSDVWSYGVTVWEMFSFGDVPYPGLAWDNDFIKWLENNFRLQKPKFATDEIYWNLLLECWRINPNERPTFPAIIAYLEHVLAKRL